MLFDGMDAEHYNWQDWNWIDNNVKTLTWVPASSNPSYDFMEEILNDWCEVTERNREDLTEEEEGEILTNEFYFMDESQFEYLKDYMKHDGAWIVSDCFKPACKDWIDKGWRPDFVGHSDSNDTCYTWEFNHNDLDYLMQELAEQDAYNEYATLDEAAREDTSLCELESYFRDKYKRLIAACANKAIQQIAEQTGLTI